ncbi:hypothetical protein H8D30_04475 [bacterium]|nr:hypothetical protein [bacterium]
MEQLLAPTIALFVVVVILFVVVKSLRPRTTYTLKSKGAIRHEIEEILARSGNREKER